MRTADTGNGKVTFFVSDSAINFPCIFLWLLPPTGGEVTYVVEMGE